MHCKNHSKDEVTEFRKNKREKLEKDLKKEELWVLFNRKWTKDMGTTDYNKEEWKKLEELIFYFMKDKDGNS